jgi:peroxiredoxin
VDWINLVHFSSLQFNSIKYRDNNSCYLTTSTGKNLLTYVLASAYSSLCDETSRTYKSVLILLSDQNLSVITISMGSLYFKFFAHNFRVA